MNDQKKRENKRVGGKKEMKELKDDRQKRKVRGNCRKMRRKEMRGSIRRRQESLFRFRNINQ